VSPFARGGALALLAAVAFGATVPLVQRFGAHVGPFATAALLYVGAAVASAVRGRDRGRARATAGRVRGEHAARIALVALAGAVVAPACLAWGVQRTSATTASLLLNMEAVFTVAIARAAFREPVGGRVLAALASIGTGGALLVLSSRGAGASATSLLGALAVMAATLAWAIDNALTRPLAELDSARVVLAKAGLGALLASALALVFGESLPAPGAAVALLLCGATGYGASLRFYLAAQRILGAARTASVFAAAPFVGALVAVAMGDRPPLLASAVAATLCAIGVALHLTEHHAHRHTHPATVHEHMHRHDDLHHDHAHEPLYEGQGEHSHAHAHVAQSHSHDHAPDVHHAHAHEHDDTTHNHS
jgi:drug/metabolite transporter (DMT)-like permease